MSGYPLFIPEFVLCTNSSLFWFKNANEPSEFRNYLSLFTIINHRSVFYNRQPPKMCYTRKTGVAVNTGSIPRGVLEWILTKLL